MDSQWCGVVLHDKLGKPERKADERISSRLLRLPDPELLEDSRIIMMRSPGCREKLLKGCCF